MSISQMIDNGLKNAIESIEARIKAATTDQPVSLKLVQVEMKRVARDTNKIMQITIRDSGLGISPELKAHLFSYGYTTKGSGTGVGLYSMKKMLDKLGGCIELNSQGKNKGAELLIELPYAS